MKRIVEAVCNEPAVSLHLRWLLQRRGWGVEQLAVSCRLWMAIDKTIRWHMFVIEWGHVGNCMRSLTVTNCNELVKITHLLPSAYAEMRIYAAT